MRVLLTNDDGIHAEGLHCLAAYFAQRCEVLVVAPDNPSSAKSHCITLHKPLRLHPVPRFGAGCGAVEHIEAYDCSGTPSDCVMLGVLHLWAGNPPQAVLSGINDGVNVAEDLTYSGTVGGALEGAVCGSPSLAVSLAGTEHCTFAAAARLADLLVSMLLYRRVFSWHRDLVQLLAQRGAATAPGVQAWDLVRIEEDGAAAYPALPDAPPAGLVGNACLNVNIPDVALEELNGVAWAAAGYREYRDVVKPVADPRGKPYYWIAGEKVTDDDTPGTDTHALARGYVSVTPLTYDLTHRGHLAQLAAWIKER